MDQGAGDTEPQDHVEEREIISNEELPSTSTHDTQRKEKRIFWTFLEHKGPVFEPPYKRLPKYVEFRYNGNVVKLSEKAEEVAGLYAKKLHRLCVTEPKFNQNFFAEWREVMTPEEQQLIKDLSKCDFKKIQEYYKDNKLNKTINKGKKQKEAKRNKNTFGYCKITNNTGETKMEPIKNHKIEPQDLFCSKGPLMGRLKKRVTPEDVTINCSADSETPKPPTTHQWKNVIHDNTVSWLASWKCNIADYKYIILDSRSNLKQENDCMKYETARELHKHIERIRTTYRNDWNAEDTLHRQKGVALYLIDNLGFRAGNEKEAGAAETVGCCSLKVKHIQLSSDNKVVFDFEGKASVRYNKEVAVEESVYENLLSFLENKNENDDLFDKLDTVKLNKYLQSHMTGLTAKVFRTYLASVKFEKHLKKKTYADRVYNSSATTIEIVKIFKQALLEIAKLLNHKIIKKKPRNTFFIQKDSTDNTIYNTRSSLCNYIDPRIVVTWCERHGIPIENVYTKALIDQFSWAIAEAGPNFLFCW